MRSGLFNVSYGGITTNTDGNVTTPNALPPIQIRRWVRNAKHPNALLQNMINEGVNQAALYRTKEVFGFCDTPLPSINSSASNRPRWRFAFHTGPYTRFIAVRAVMTQPTSLSPATATSKTQLDLTSSAGTVSETFVGGPLIPTSGSDPLFDQQTVTEKLMPVTPDTEYTGLFTDLPYGRVVAATCYEVVSIFETTTGYLPQNLGMTSPIVSDYRANAADAMRKLWRRGAAPILNWTVNGQLPGYNTITATTLTNIYDHASTSVTANTLGYNLQLTNHARRSQASSGVPVRFGVCCDTTACTGNSFVAIVNSAGTVLSQTRLTGFGESWSFVNGTMPATLDKYDVQAFTHSGGTLKLLAVALWEQEP